MRKRTDTIHRAWLYITRKKSKSILLFLILFVLTMLVTAGVAVGNAAGRASLELRRTIGSYFKLEENTQYTGTKEAITDELVERIAGQEGIRASNKVILQYLMTPELTLEPGRFTGEQDERAKLARFLGASDSALHEYFLLRSLQLKEGRQIGPEDEGKALISETLAELNGLTVGDIITGAVDIEEAEAADMGGSGAARIEGAEAADMGSSGAARIEEAEAADMEGNGAARIDGNRGHEIKSGNEIRTGNGIRTGKRYAWEIAGIFEVNTDTKSDALTAECDMINNFIFVDEKSLMQVQTDMDTKNEGKYRQAVFFVEDPAQLEQIMAQALQIEGVNWDSFHVSVNEQAYQRAAGPLKRLEIYCRLFLTVIIVISVILLALILTLWMRDRRQEMGVLMAAGIRKTSLVGQHVAEVFLLVLMALAAALPVSGLVVDRAGSALIQETPREEKREKQSWEIFYDPVELSEAESGEMMQAYVGAEELLFAVLYGFGTGGLAVGLSSAWILRTKPREILSSMS